MELKLQQGVQFSNLAAQVVTGDSTDSQDGFMILVLLLRKTKEETKQGLEGDTAFVAGYVMNFNCFNFSAIHSLGLNLLPMSLP